MQGRKLSRKQPRQPRASSPRLPPVDLNSQNALPNSEGILGQGQHKQRSVGPLSPPSLGPAPLMGKSNRLNRMNNIKSPMSRPNIGNKAPYQSTDYPTQFKSSQGPPQFREHDQYLPIANVVRIMRRALPPQAKVADEAKEMVQDSVSEFISFITSEANETCQLEHRKTITAEDVIGAMSKLGFDHYVEPLMMYLQKYRESEMLVPPQNSGVSHGGNNGPSHEPGLGATRFMPTTNRLPPFAVVYPQFPMFCPAGIGGYYYHDGSGPSIGPMNMGFNSAPVATIQDGGGSGLSTGPSTAPINMGFNSAPVATIQDGSGSGPSTGPMNMGFNSAPVATVQDGDEPNGPNLALSISGGPGGSGGAGPSGSSKDGLGFYDPYAQYK